VGSRGGPPRKKKDIGKKTAFIKKRVRGEWESDSIRITGGENLEEKDRSKNLKEHASRRSMYGQYSFCGGERGWVPPGTGPINITNFGELGGQRGRKRKFKPGREGVGWCKGIYRS